MEIVMSKANMKTQDAYQVSLDVRGFLRFSSATCESLQVKDYQFIQIFVDKIGRRIAMELIKQEVPGCFRLLDHNGRYLTYVQGAMSAAGIKLKSGAQTLIPEKNLLVLSPGKTQKTGEWQDFHCRNSAGIPLGSLDRRGTLILDRNCTSAIDMEANGFADAAYDSRRKIFTLTFGKKGALRVRPIAKHANISFMGTLSACGLALPEEHGRVICSIKGKTLSFSVADLFHPTP